MKKKTLVIGTIAAATVLGGSLALAHQAGYGPNNCGGPQMHGQYGPMGPGMRGQYGPGPRGPMDTGVFGQRGPGWQGGPRFAALDPAQLNTLKTELGITAEQEAAWTKYTKTVQDAATAMKTARTELTTQLDKVRQERMAAQTKMRDEAKKQFDTVTIAASDVLAKLNDTQKAKAQQSLPGLTFSPGAHQAGGPGAHQAGGPGWHHHWR